MSSILELRDGFGWTTLTGTTISDEHGTALTMTSSGNKVVKTLYSAHTRHSLSFVSKTFRVYENNHATHAAVVVTVTILNLSPVYAAFDLTVPSGGYVDFIAEGYAVVGGTNPTVEIVNKSGSGYPAVYLCKESGY